MAEPVARPGPAAAVLLRLGAAFTYPAFRNLWTAAFTSAAGTWMQRFAQQWLIFDLTGSAFYLGLDAFVGAVPLLLFTLIGGVTADRYDRRHLLMASQILQMACALVLTLLVLFDAVHLAYILALSFVTGLAQAFGGPAFQSLIPALVPRHTLPNAVALNSIQFNLAQSIGPAIGGLVFTSLGLAACFGLNSVSFLVVIVVLALMQAQPANRERNKTVAEDLKGGLTVRRAGRRAAGAHRPGRHHDVARPPAARLPAGLRGRPRDAQPDDDHPGHRRRHRRAGRRLARASSSAWA